MRMDYPAGPMPPIVGPVTRGVAEPAVGCVVGFSRDPDHGQGGLGLGVDGESHCPITINARRQLLVGGYTSGMTNLIFEIPEKIRQAAAQDGQRFGLTVQIRTNALAVTVRAGTNAAMKEMRILAPITPEQRDRLMTRHMAVIAKGGCQEVTPFIDDARRLPPDLAKPAAPNRWRFDGFDQLFTLYKAAYRLKEKAPIPLLALKTGMLAAVDKDPATQAQAVKEYENRIAMVIDAVRMSGAAPDLVAAALGDLTGVSLKLAISNQ
jgi:hypothetical protein